MHCAYLKTFLVSSDNKCQERDLIGHTLCETAPLSIDLFESAFLSKEAVVQCSANQLYLLMVFIKKENQCLFLSDSDKLDGKQSCSAMDQCVRTRA